MNPDPPLRTRRATAADQAALAALDARCSPQPWTPERWKRAMATRLVLRAARAPGGAVGYAVGDLSGDTCRLIRIGLDPAERRPEDLSALIVAFVAEARRCGALEVELEVRADDRDAVTAFAQAGFRAAEDGRAGSPEGPGSVWLILRSSSIFFAEELSPLRALALAAAQEEELPDEDEGDTCSLEDNPPIAPPPDPLEDGLSWLQRVGTPDPPAEAPPEPSADDQEIEEEEPADPEARRVAELLTSGDYKLIEQGIELVKALGNPGLCDWLLKDVQFDLYDFRLRGVFQSDDPKVFRNRYALFRLISEVRETSPRAQGLISGFPEEFRIDGSISLDSADPERDMDLHLDVVHLEGMNAFTNLRSLHITMCEGISGLHHLAELPALEKLRIFGAPPVDIRELAGSRSAASTSRAWTSSPACRGSGSSASCPAPPSGTSRP